MKQTRIWLSAGLVSLMLLLGDMARAGACEPVDNAQRFSFAFNRVFATPEENATDALYPNAYEWNLGRLYSGRCACSGSTLPGGVYFTTRTSLAKGMSRGVNGVNVQFYEINRNLQLGTEIYLAGLVKAFKPTPWSRLFNENTGSFNCSQGSALVSNFETGSRGRLHLLISRPFVGVINVSEFKVLDVFGSMHDAGAEPVKPLVGLFMSMSVTVPQNCRLAPGQSTTIDFGSLLASQLAVPGGSRQGAVSRSFYIQCANISAGVRINLALEGRPHGRDARYLETSHQNVAVAMESGGKLVPPTVPGALPVGNQLIPIALDYDNLRALFDLTAWPVKMTERPVPGAFQGSATLKFDFE
ncbi:fimbrial protein [Chromobacterium sp. IRSSSOUMB001]|uniref:fimbrial protein n=1 Tax=Chromobacterium sp. IRSSSOUMB001 TaxID=2927123 RepID=UPI00209B8005|nr:fimbrial protein [Chromobacterium sp. IRSSSOUMB001]